jgi:hypothetical protein
MQVAAQAVDIASLTAARDLAAARAGKFGGALASEEEAHAQTRAALAAAQGKVRRMAPLCMQPSTCTPCQDHLLGSCVMPCCSAFLLCCCCMQQVTAQQAMQTLQPSEALCSCCPVRADAWLMQTDALAADIASLAAARDQSAARSGQLAIALASEEEAHAQTRADLATAQGQVRRMAPLCMQPSPAHLTRGPFLSCLV